MFDRLDPISDALGRANETSISELRGSKTQTLRVVSPGLEEILHLPISVLDHGFIRVVDYMGDDSSVVQAARVSYGRGTKKSREDIALIRYLLRHNHTTPFEMAEIKLHVKLPIFVARQWIRHRTASVNEYSARYSVLDKEFYIPGPEQLGAQSSTNRQGRGDVLSGDEADHVLRLLRADAESSYSNYLNLLNEGSGGTPADPDRTGLARELARINLSVNFYTQWYWKIDLHNLMGFLRLRADPHAQYEIRAYAEIMLRILERWVPATFSAFKEYRLGALQLSAAGAAIVRRLLSGEAVDASSSGLGKREWEELCLALGIRS